MYFQCHRHWFNYVGEREKFWKLEEEKVTVIELKQPGKMVKRKKAIINPLGLNLTLHGELKIYFSDFIADIIEDYQTQESYRVMNCEIHKEK